MCGAGTTPQPHSRSERGQSTRHSSLPTGPGPGAVPGRSPRSRPEDLSRIQNMECHQQPHRRPPAATALKGQSSRLGLEDPSGAGQIPQPHSRYESHRATTIEEATSSCIEGPILEAVTRRTPAEQAQGLSRIQNMSHQATIERGHQQQGIEGPIPLRKARRTPAEQAEASAAFRQICHRMVNGHSQIGTSHPYPASLCPDCSHQRNT